MHKVEAVLEGRRWAIRHGAGYLGHVDTEAEALALIASLQGAPADTAEPRPVEAPAAPARIAA